MKKTIIAITVLIAISLYLWWGNNDIVITTLNYDSEKIPSNLDGYRIVQISDFHNKRFKELSEEIVKCEPDIIIITGDLIDRKSKDISPTLELIDSAIAIAPVYYVSGNHEATTDKWPDLKEKLLEAGVIILAGEKIELDNGISLIGLEDRQFNLQTDEVLRELSDINDFQILLSHRPELFDTYVKHGIDLVFTGHAHGGGVRLPFIGGLAAPNQGIFPKYTSGKYAKDETTMIVSRGLGSSSHFPLRIFNMPEIVVVELSRNP